ncbi:microfibril-associated glycoprotein 4-like isoform X1 [Uranotaenia lowii]|uniref:microfibril-associated glycoprotein 4-like isoform X1 n=1 Tax=Uranotaenia lowii TaxID=190385 RepID=UPI00247A0345|nr:microfibril-associated glycoprotein 4-like isoform X1 [Uranotaenia lowii]
MALLLVFLAVVASQDVLPRSCVDIQSASGVYEIHPEYGFGKPIDVYCEQSAENGGWIVIQNRFNGSVHFYRGWKDYENGFGDWRGEFWLGLKSIHRITYSQSYELLIQIGDTDDNIKYARGDGASMCWKAFKGFYYGLKTSRMMIRPVGQTSK